MEHLPHDPDPEFLSRLEAQLVTDHRRMERLGHSSQPAYDVGRWLRAAGFTFAGLLIGCASMTTVQQLDRAGKLEQLQRQAEANVQIATERVAVNRRILETLMERWAAGVVDASNAMILSAREDVTEAETALTLAELDVAEIDAGGDPSRDEISAPLAGGRDFLAARWQIELNAIAERARGLDEIIEFTEARVNAGVEVARNLSPLTTERERLIIAASRIADTLALRQSFLGGSIDADQVELRHRLLLATASRQTAQAEFDALRSEDEMLQQRFIAGLISSDEIAATERDLLRAEAAVQIAEMEMELVARRLEP